jgi:hypothetical protein
MRTSINFHQFQYITLMCYISQFALTFVLCFEILVNHISSYLQSLNCRVIHYYVSEKIVLKIDISTMISIKYLH